MRSVLDMVEGRNAPLPPGHNSCGKTLSSMGSHQCRFPVREVIGRIFFCAEDVPAGEWMPGKQHGCYCRFHREFLRGCLPVTEAAA